MWTVKTAFFHLECSSLPNETVESTPKRYAQVIKKVRASLLAKTEHEALRKQKLSENVNSLTQLEATIHNLGLGVHCEIESVAGVTNTSFLSVTASDCKDYSESVGPFHRVKLLISPEGSYELRVNIVDRVETGKVDLDDVGKLRQVVANITGNNLFRICPGLTFGIIDVQCGTNLGTDLSAMNYLIAAKIVKFSPVNLTLLLNVGKTAHSRQIVAVNK